MIATSLALGEGQGSDVRITDPGLLGSVLVSSEITERTVDDLFAEFDIEPLDDDLARSIAKLRDTNTSTV